MFLEEEKPKAHHVDFFENRTREVKFPCCIYTSSLLTPGPPTVFLLLPDAGL